MQINHQERRYWIINLILAHGLARRYKVSHEAAVKRCARKMRDSTCCEATKRVASDLLSLPTHQIEMVIKDMEEKYVGAKAKECSR